MTWLLCDYGGVLSAPQDPARRRSMAQRCGMGEEEFAAAYWARRADYDQGLLSAGEYWATVRAGADVEALVADDVAGWTHLDPASMAAMGRAAARGMRPAILSNAPREVAEGIDGLGGLADLSPRLFSWALGVVKPDPAIYRIALDRLGAAASEVVFVDDRPDNVAAARDLGIDAHVYTGPEVFDRLGP